MNVRMSTLALALLVTIAPASRASLTDVSYYGTNGTNVITHYSPTGAILGTFTVSSQLAVGGIRGLAFDYGNGLYYGANSNSNGNLIVLAFDSSGIVHETYTTATPAFGNIGQGKIIFDGPNNFYVGNSFGVQQFTVGVANSGKTIFNGSSNGAFDIKTLPNGDLIVAGDYEIKEITQSGNLVRTFTPASGTPSFVDIQALAFDPATDSLYVAMLGDSLNSYKIEKFDYKSGALLASTTFYNPESLVFTNTGELLVGSRIQAPALFDSNLNFIEQFDGTPQLFVTEVVPEPASLALLAIGSIMTVGGVGTWRRWRGERLA